MNFILKIFQGKIDKTVHTQFVRFGKGTFENKAVMNVRSNNKIKVSTTFELVNDLVLFAAELAERLSVSGIILSKHSNKFDAELKDLLGKGEKKKNLSSFSITKELSLEELKKIAKIAYYMLLDCNAPGIGLSIKKKLPKPKSQRRDKPPKIDDKFCVLELDKKFQQQLHNEFLFDLPHEFKKIRIDHCYVITDIVMPKGERDFALLRLLAKRKGKVVRHAIVDGKESVSEKSFIA